jgi:hypothetical protein
MPDGIDHFVELDQLHDRALGLGIGDLLGDQDGSETEQQDQQRDACDFTHNFPPYHYWKFTIAGEGVAPSPTTTILQ